MSNQTLYLSYDGLTDPLGQSQVLPYLIGLSKKGWGISVVSFEKEERYKTGKHDIETICKEARIDWTPLIYHKKPPILSTLRDLKAMRKAVADLITFKKPKLIHCRSYLPMIIALPYQKKGIKVLFDLRGFWPDERVEGNIWNLKNPLYKFIYTYFKKKEKVFLRSVDAIVALTKAAIPTLKKLGATNEIYTIPTSTDLSLFERSKISTVEREKWMQKHDLNGKYILGYAGSLGTWYLLDEMLQFFKILKFKKESAHFLIVSKDSKDIVIDKAINLGISNTDYTIISGQREDMPTLYSLFDSAIMFIKPSFSKTASSPTKLGELMAMGIPTVCNSGIGDVDEIIEKYNAGIVLEDLNHRSIAKGVETILEGNYFDVNSMKEGALDYYDLEKGVERYNEIYTKLIR